VTLLSPAEAARIRKERGWSQQYLASQSGVNKAYISEYESGIRPNLPQEMIERLSAILLAPPAGRVRAQIAEYRGRNRLILTDSQGNVFRPKVASVHWTEDDGTSYTMYLGEVEIE